LHDPAKRSCPAWIAGKVGLMDSIKMRPLTTPLYEKRNERVAWRNMPYQEKVKCVVELQKRIAPIFAQRQKIIKPWTDVP